MQYPLISEYIDAIRSAEDNFDKLTYLRPVLDSNGNPVMSSGNFAVVFKMKDVETERLYAVKCFTREQEERAERYHEIIKALRKIESPYFVSTHYYDKELFVDNTQSDDSEFPVLVMNWVDGMPLDAYMKTIEGSQFKRELLAKQFQELVCWLLPKHFAHGDIKPDNIIVKEDGSIVLVDYDGMFVPSLRGKEALEMGTPMYRHPGRTLAFFNEYIDDYAAVMLLTLLKVNALTAIDYEHFLTDNTIVFFKHFEHLLIHPTIAPLLSAYIMVATSGRIDRQQLSCLLSDNSNFDYNKESILQDFARQGDTVAMNELARLYRNGVYVPKNTSKAMQWYTLSKLLGNIDAICGLCTCISNNDDFITKNEIIQDNLKKCRITFAYCREGEILRYDKKHEQAILLYRKAAEYGSAAAQNHLAIRYYYGEGVDKDLEQAIYWWKKAAEAGNTNAQNSLAGKYYFGEGVDKNLEQAVYWWKKAAEAGNAYAQNILAKLYYKGEGVGKNLEQAVYWWRKAAEAGNTNAQGCLAGKYHFGEGVGKNIEQAIYWWRKAAEAGNSDAQNILAMLYYKGEGVGKDFEQAMYWWRKAAETGNTDAQNSLAKLYYKGEDIVKNLEQAVYWWQKAAEAGDSRAECCLDYFCKQRKIFDVVNVKNGEMPHYVAPTNTGVYSTDGKRFLRYFGTHESDYKIHDGTEILCDDSFNDLYYEIEGHNLSKIYIPKTLKRIGNNVFCASISYISCESPNFKVKNGFLLSHDEAILYRYYSDENLVHIPKGIRYIKGGAFSEKNVENVIIPDTIDLIGDNPFAGCRGIKIISNSNRFQIINNTLYDMTEKRLIGCYNYEESHIYIKSGTKSIGKNAFFGLDIQFVYIPESIEDIDETSFYWCFNLHSIAIPSHQYKRIYNLIPSYIKKYVFEDDGLPF